MTKPIESARRWTIKVRKCETGFSVGWEGAEIGQFYEGGVLKEQDILIIEAAPVLAEIERLKDEITEQCRLNGMGQQREMKLMAEVERLKKALEKATAQRNSWLERVNLKHKVVLECIQDDDAEIQAILEGK